MGIEEVFPRTAFYILGIPVRNSVVQSWIILVILLGLALWKRTHYRAWEPQGWQVALEYLLEFINNLIKDMGGRPLPQLVPFMVTMIVFIALANLLGLVPLLYAPTRDLNTTTAVALMSFLFMHYQGIRQRGLGKYLHSFLEPAAFMLPLNLIGMLTRTLSLALRLFGNVLAAEIIGSVMFMLVPLLAPLPLSILGIVTGLLQALVFTILSIVFTVDAMGAGEA
jgi:F-type H+-transporting ATPase subunit a